MRKKSKEKSRKRRRPARKKPPTRRDKEVALVQLLVENPTEAMKQMGAEYIVKHRDRLIRGIEDYLLDMFE